MVAKAAEPSIERSTRTRCGVESKIATAFPPLKTAYLIKNFGIGINHVVKQISKKYIRKTFMSLIAVSVNAKYAK